MQFVWSVARPQEFRELLKCFQCVARVGDLCSGHTVLVEIDLGSEMVTSSDVGMCPIRTLYLLRCFKQEA